MSAPLTGQYSFFPDVVYSDAYSTIRRGIRWFSRSSSAAQRRRQQRAATDGELPEGELDGRRTTEDELEGRGGHHLAVDTDGDASFAGSSTSSSGRSFHQEPFLTARSQSGQQAQQQLAATTGSVGWAASDGALSSSTSTPSDRRSSDSSPGTGDSVGSSGRSLSSPIFVKCIRHDQHAHAAVGAGHHRTALFPAPAPPLSASETPVPFTHYGLQHLRAERLICSRLASLAPVELVANSASSGEQPPEGPFALAWTDHGGQPLPELWRLGTLSRRLTVTDEGDTADGDEARDPSPASPSFFTSAPARARPAPCSLVEFLHFAIGLTERLHELHSAAVVFNFLHPPIILYKENADFDAVQLLDYTFATLSSSSARPDFSSSSSSSSRPSSSHLTSLARPPLPQSFLPYVAPEMFDSAAALSPSLSSDVRSDLYSMGIVLYELCTGRPPFFSSTANLWRMRHWHRAKLPRPVTFPSRWTGDGASGEEGYNTQCMASDTHDCVQLLGEVVMKLLSKGVEQRYQTAAGLLFDLKHLRAMADRSLLNRSSVPFQVGNRDTAATFRVSPVIFGRDELVQQLLTLYERVEAPQPAPSAERRCDVVLVRGEQGSGKTSLLQLLQRKFQQRWGDDQPGSVVYARFDDQPTSAQGDFLPSVALLLHCMQSLVIQTLTAIVDVERGRALLAQAVDGYEPLCQTMLPGLKPFMEHTATILPSSSDDHTPLPSPSSPPWDAPSASRFADETSLTRRLLRAFAGPSNCVVLLLDDVHLCDQQGRDFLDRLLDPQAHSLDELPHMLLVAMFTASSPSTPPPLSSIASLQLSLPPLQLSSVTELLRDSLPQSAAASLSPLSSDSSPSPSARSVASPNGVEELASLLLLKTGGYPVALSAALHCLYEHQLLHFDYHTGQWSWRLDSIKFFDLGPPPLPLLQSRMSSLNHEQSRVLRVAACIGHDFTAAAIALCLSVPSGGVRELLLPALSAGLVLPIGRGLELPAAPDVSLRFVHPRIRDAFYDLCSTAFRQHVHLTYARSFLQPLDGEVDEAAIQSRVEEHILEVVHHYELCTALITPRLPADGHTPAWDSEEELMKVEEMRQVVAFGLAASRAAQRSKDSALALQHAQFAYSCTQSLLDFSHRLPQRASAGGKVPVVASPWAVSYDVCLALFRQYASLLYNAGDIAQADAVVSTALLHTTTTMDHVRLHDLRLDAALIRGDCSAAVNTGLQVLELLGTRLHPYSAEEMAAYATEEAIMALLAQAEQRQSGHNETTVQVSHYLARLLMPSLLDGRYFLDVLSTCAWLMHSHGMTLYDPLPIAFYSVPLLSANPPNVEMAHSACTLTLAHLRDTVDLYTTNRSVAQLIQLQLSTTYALFVSPWKVPLQETIEQLEELRRGLLQLSTEATMARSRISVSHLDFHYIERLFWAGVPLPRVLVAQQEAASTKRGRAVSLYKEHYRATRLLLTSLMKWEEQHKAHAPRGAEAEAVDGADGNDVRPVLIRPMSDLTGIAHPSQHMSPLSSSVTFDIPTASSRPPPTHVGSSTSIVDVSFELEQRLSALVSSPAHPMLASVGQVWLLLWHFLTANHKAALQLWPRMRTQERAAAALVTHPHALFLAALCTATEATERIHHRSGVDPTSPLHIPRSTTAPASALFPRPPVSELVESVEELLAEASGRYAGAVNFHQKWALVQAELLKLRMLLGDIPRLHAYLPALELYDRAIAQSRDCLCLPDEAIACELAGRFTLMYRRHVEAKSYLQQAVDAYKAWGCLVKVSALSLEFADLIAQSATTRAASVEDASALTAVAAAPSSSVVRTTTPPVPMALSASSSVLDAAVLIRMTQTFSVETNLDLLLRKLMKIVLRQAGASRCHLLMNAEQRWRVDLTAVLDQSRAQPSSSSEPQLTPSSDEGGEDDISFINYREDSGAGALQVNKVMPRSLFLYSLSTLTPLSLGDADLSHGPFALDPYWTTNRPKAVTVMPIVRHAQAMAVLYLEDDHGPDPLPPSSMSALQLVCSQAALSLENAGQTSALLGNNWRLEEEVRLRREAVEEMTRAKEMAEKASAVKSEFLSNMSHEIRTPMNGVIGNLELLLSSEGEDEQAAAANPTLTAEQREILSVVKASAESVLQIIGDILDLSKIEAGRLELQMSTFEVRACVEKSLDVVATRALSKGLDLLQQVHHEVPFLIAQDQNRLTQILFNLLSNAVKFTTKGEVIVTLAMDKVGKEVEAAADGLVTTQKNGATQSYLLHFEVQDSGMGISAKAQEGLFLPFSQVHSDIARNLGGTGLGLAISKRLVELMGGRLWVVSEVGRGSCFHFTVPCAGQDTERPRYLTPTWLLPASERIIHSPVARLLLIDANPVTSRALMDAVALWSIESLWAHTVAEALTLLQAQPRPSIQALLIDHRALYSDEGLQAVLQAESEMEEKRSRAIADGDAVPLPPVLHDLTRLEELKRAMVPPGAAASEPLPVRFIVFVPVTFQSRLRAASPVPLLCISTPVKPRTLFHVLTETEPDGRSPSSSPFASSSSLASRVKLGRSPATPKGRTLNPSRSARSATLPLPSTAVPHLQLPRSSVGAKAGTLGSSSPPSPSSSSSASPGVGSPLRPSFAEQFPFDGLVIVEDNFVNQKLLQRMLIKLGYPAKRLLTADNGAISVELVEKHAADSAEPLLVLMDVFMPVMDGLEATRRMRALPALAPTDSRRPYIIALTANAMQGDRDVCITAGMDSYLPKPVTLEALKAEMRTAHQHLTQQTQTHSTTHMHSTNHTNHTQAAAPQTDA